MNDKSKKKPSKQISSLVVTTTKNGKTRELKLGVDYTFYGKVITFNKDNSQFEVQYGFKKETK